MTRATISLRDAQDAIRKGALYGDVFPLLADEDKPALAAWFIRTRDVPNTAARVSVGTATGEACKRCGGLQVRTGSCMTCQFCGESSGCG